MSKESQLTEFTQFWTVTARSGFCKIYYTQNWRKWMYMNAGKWMWMWVKPYNFIYISWVICMCSSCHITPFFFYVHLCIPAYCLPFWGFLWPLIMNQKVCHMLCNNVCFIYMSYAIQQCILYIFSWRNHGRSWITINYCTLIDLY